MKLRNFKTPNFNQSKIKPIFKKLSSRNTGKSFNTPTFNNLNELEQKDTINSQNFQNSIITLDISFNEESQIHEETGNFALYKKYLLSKTEFNKMISEIEYIDNKIAQNKNTIEILEKHLSNLKEEKKMKNEKLIDFLSNKESLEEIYNIKISSLVNNSQQFIKKKINGNIKENNNSNNNDNSPFSTISILEDNDNLEIKIEDIKQCDKKKYIELVINFTEDILQKREMEIRNKLIQKINIGFQRFFSEFKSKTFIDPKKIISNFFSKISIFISNQSKGKFPEHYINSFLRGLLQINSINVEISEILKFNKKYKEKKLEIKEKICNLVNKNEGLKTKKKTYETKKNECKQFLDENRDKIKSGDKNKICLENDNKQYMSFILDNHFQEELGFLNDDKKDEINEKIEIKKDNKKNNTINENVEQININEINEDDKANKVKVINMKNLPNNWNEKCNGINNINVNNLLINNNINIENNNIINNQNSNKNSINNKNNIENKKENNNNIDNNKEIIKSKKNNEEKEKETAENENKKKIIKIKEMKCIPLKKIKLGLQKTNMFYSPIKLNKANCCNKILLQKNSPQFYKNSKSPSRTKTLNYRDYDNNNNSFNSQNIYNPKFKIIAQGVKETFCYFKLSDNNNIRFNPLNNTNENPIKFNYFEGSILIDSNFNKLKIIQKSEQKYIGIELKDIAEINLSDDMEKIIKVYKVYLKNGKNIENFDINQFISSDKEIIGIRMNQNDKIKSIECKFFIFSIIIGKRFVPKAEFIFNNYENFNIWYNCLKSIVKINNSCKDKDTK